MGRQEEKAVKLAATAFYGNPAIGFLKRLSIRWKEIIVFFFIVTPIVVSFLTLVAALLYKYIVLHLWAIV